MKTCAYLMLEHALWVNVDEFSYDAVNKTFSLAFDRVPEEIIYRKVENISVCYMGKPEIVCDETNNTQDIIDNNELKISVKATWPKIVCFENIKANIITNNGKGIYLINFTYDSVYESIDSI